MTVAHWTYRAGWTLVLAAFLLVPAGCSQEKAAPKTVVRPVKTMTLGTPGHGSAWTYPGRVDASSKVDLAFKVTGPLVELPVREGDRKKQGDLLAKIDPRDFQTNLKNAEAMLAQSKAQLSAMREGARPEDRKTLEAIRDASKAELDRADADYRRKAILLQSKTVSQEEFDRVKATRDLAQAKYERSIQELKKGMIGARKEDIQAKEAEIKQYEAQVKKAKDALDDSELHAPFDGVVAKRYVENFENVMAKQPIVLYQNVKQMEVVVNLPEAVSFRNKKDLAGIEATFPNLPGKKFPLTVKEFSTSPNPDTNTYRLALTMDVPEGVTILPGVSATVTIQWKAAGGQADQFSVPAGAVVNLAGKGSFVWSVSDDMTVHRCPVTMGTMNGGTVLISGDLKPGQVIAVAGVHELEEGTKVRVFDDADKKETP